MFGPEFELALKIYFGLVIFAAFVVGAIVSAVIMWVL